MRVHEAIFLASLALIVALQTQARQPPKLDGRGIAPLAVLPQRWAAQPIDGEDRQHWALPSRPLQD